MKSKCFLFGYFLFVLFLLSVFSMDTFASQITLISEKEYYFATGEDANIVILTNNTFAQQKHGTLTYTITQEINQGGFSMQNTDTRSASLSINAGTSGLQLNLGTSQQPLRLQLDLLYVYENTDVKLGPILIYFTQDPYQQNSQQNQNQQQNNQQQSSSQTQEQRQQAQQEAMEQRMQEMLEQMQQQQQNNNNAAQRMQNNQMSQDSRSLQEQMRQQAQEQQQLNQEFQESLSQNQEFQQAQKEFLEQGYQPTQAKIDAQNSTTGDFEVEFQNEQGEKATLSGNMQDNEMQELTSSLDQKRLQEKLLQDQRYQQLSQELMQQGFQPQELTQQKEGNQTTFTQEFVNAQNETATLTATGEDEEITDVKIERQRLYTWLWFAVFLLLVILGVFVYKKYFSKQLLDEIEEEQIEEVFDHKEESLKLIEIAKKKYKKKKIKEAYSYLSQSLRLFLSYEYKLNKEITSYEIVNYLRSKKLSYKQIQSLFGICEGIEFAKVVDKKDQFGNVLNRIREIVD